MFYFITSRHVKIWLGPLKLQNSLRLRNLRNINPGSDLFLIYEPGLLSVSENKYIQSLCAELGINLLNVVSDIVPQCSTAMELDLVTDANAAMQPSEQGGNLAAASDILRWLSPVYKLGTYSDMDVLIDTSRLPDVITVKKPLIFNLGSLTAFGTDLPAINNDILAVVNATAAAPLIHKIQQNIHNGCRLYQPRGDAFSHIKGVYNSLPDHPNSTFFSFLISGGLPLSSELSNIADGKSVVKMRAEIIRRTANKSNYCEYYPWWCLYYTITSWGSESAFNSKIKGHRSSLLKKSVIFSSGPGVALMAFSDYKSYPTSDFISDKAPHSLSYYKLDAHFQSGNSFLLHTGLVDLIKMAFGGKRSDISWLQEGKESIEQYENKLLAIESSIKISSATDVRIAKNTNRMVSPLNLIELNKLAQLHLMQLAELQHQFAMNKLCNEPRSVTFAACAKSNGTSVCVQTQVNFQAPSTFSRPALPQNIHYSCQPSLIGEPGSFCTTELTQELCDQSMVSGCATQGLTPVIATSATMGASAAFIPEAVGDALRLIANMSPAQANYATQATNLLFIALTGSWFSAGVGMVTQFVGELGGLSKQNARLLGNTASIAINVLQSPCPSTVIAAGVSFAAGKFGLWAEKKIANKFEDYVESRRARI